MSRPRASVNGNSIERYLLTTPDYAAMRGWSQQSARKERTRKKGPPHIHVSRAAYYSIHDVEDYLTRRGYEFKPYNPSTESKEQYLVRMNAGLKS